MMKNNARHGIDDGCSRVIPHRQAYLALSKNGPLPAAIKYCAFQLFGYKAKPGGKQPSPTSAASFFRLYFSFFSDLVTNIEMPTIEGGGSKKWGLPLVGGKGTGAGVGRDCNGDGGGVSGLTSSPSQRSPQGSS